MTAQGEKPGPKAGEDRVKCPPAMQAEIKRAMALLLREQVNCDWHLFRERTDFAPWIGAASGEAGRRKFFRWKKKLLRLLPADRTRPHAGRELHEEQQAWAETEARAAAERGNQLIALSPRLVLAGGATALAGFPQLGARLGRLADDVERLRRIALVEDPEGYNGFSVVDTDLLLKADRAERELIQTSTAFLREYNALLGHEDFNHDLLQLLEDEFADEPERRDRLLELVADLINRHGRGAPARN